MMQQPTSLSHAILRLKKDIIALFSMPIWDLTFECAYQRRNIQFPIEISRTTATEKNESSNFHGWARIKVNRIVVIKIEKSFLSSEMKSNPRERYHGSDWWARSQINVHRCEGMMAWGREVESDENDLFILQSDKKNINICMQTLLGYILEHIKRKKTPSLHTKQKHRVLSNHHHRLHHM